MMRLACCLATERGIRVCCPVHDALMVEGPADEIDTVVRDTQAAMLEAGEILLDGFQLRTDADIVRYPDRYEDKRGETMWNTVLDILGDDRKAITPRIGNRYATVSESDNPYSLISYVLSL